MAYNNLEYKQIANGVKYICIDTDKFNTNSLILDMYLPVDDNLPAYKILASLLTRSSSNYPSQKLMDSKLEWLYGANISSTTKITGEMFHIAYKVIMVDDKFAVDNEKISEMTEDFLFDIILNPHFDGDAFDEADTDREKRTITDELNSIKNDKISYASRRLKEIMCSNQACGIGLDTMLKGINDTDKNMLYNAYFEMLSRANIAVTACGRLNADKLEEKIRGFVSNIKARNPIEERYKYITETGDVKYVKESMDMNQSKLDIGFRTMMKDRKDNYRAYSIMTDIFGGGPYSRLFTNVREKMSLCYYCSANFTRDIGVIALQSGIENENYDKALEEILNQFDIMKKGEFSDSELEASKKSTIDSYKGLDDSPMRICYFYAAQVFDERIRSKDEIIREITFIGRDQVTEAASNTSLDTVYFLAGEAEE